MFGVAGARPETCSLPGERGRPIDLCRSAVGASNSVKRRLPIGIQTFREVRENHYYIDKMSYAARLVSEGEHYFLSCPRRFGKSLFVDTLKELFEGNESLFRGLDVHDTWDWSVRHPVVRLDFGLGGFKDPASLHSSLMAHFEAIERRAGVEGRYATGPERFANLIAELHQLAGQRVVVLVDEYDKPILDALGTPDVTRANRDYLRDVYSVVKAADADIKFTFFTGVSKFSKVSLFSDLNNLADITLNPRYSSICGYTDEDLTEVFEPELAGLDRQAVRDWYNGYGWLGEERLYNPFDILLLFFNREFRAYWFETGTPSFLIDTLRRRRVPTPSLDGMMGTVDLLSTFDVDDMATEALLFQTGYLTIREEEKVGDESVYRLGGLEPRSPPEPEPHPPARPGAGPLGPVEAGHRTPPPARRKRLRWLGNPVSGVVRWHPVPVARQQRHRELRRLLR